MSLFEKIVLIGGYPLKIPLLTRLDPSRFTAEDLVSIEASYYSIQFWLSTFCPFRGANPGDFWKLGVKPDLEKRIVENGCKIPEAQFPLFAEVAYRLCNHLIPDFIDALKSYVIDPENLKAFWLYITRKDYFCNNTHGIARFLPHLDEDSAEAILTSLDDSDRSMLLTQVANANLYALSSALPKVIARTSSGALENFLGSIAANERPLDQRLLDTLQEKRYPKTLAKAFCVPLTYGLVGCEPENAFYSIYHLDQFVDRAYPFNPYQKAMEDYDSNKWAPIFAHMFWLGRIDFRSAYYCVKSDHEREKVLHYSDNTRTVTQRANNETYKTYSHYRFLDLVLKRATPKDRIEHLFDVLDLNWRFHDALNGKGSWRLLDEAMLLLGALPIVGRNTLKTALRKFAGKMGGSLSHCLFAPNKLQYYFLTWEVCENFARATDIIKGTANRRHSSFDSAPLFWDRHCRQELYAWYHEWLETHMTSDMYRFLSN